VPTLKALQRGAYFDAICFWHSLEHHADPRTALSIAAEHLRPGGVVVIECPNADSFDARINRGRWDGWHLPYHTVHLTPATLSRELKRCGLKVESIRTSLWPPLAAVARRLRRSPRNRQSPESAHLPFLLRQTPGSVSARLARIFSGRDMVVVARAS
jgi:SAM-dependent methyltransferase